MYATLIVKNLQLKLDSQLQRVIIERIHEEQTKLVRCADSLMLAAAVFP